MTKILITGANGFIGRQLVDTLKNESNQQIYATSLKPDAYSSDGYQYVSIDLTNSKNVIETIEQIKPDIIINTAAMSSIPECEQNPAKANAINVDAVSNLVEAAKRVKARLIQISTDFVFDGKSKELYTEADKPNPVNNYGKSKLEAESIVLNQLEDAVVVRIAVVYGRPLPGQHSNIVELIKSKLDKDEEVTLVEDQWRTPTYVGDICQGIQKIISGKHSGIYHICGSESVTIYDLGLEIAKLMDKDLSLIQAVKSGLDLASPRRPLATPLSNAKAKRELGYKTLSIADYITRR